MRKRKIILNLCTSLDFFIEGIKGEIDWCLTDQDYSMTEFLNNIDTIFFGRLSYEQLMRDFPNGFPDKKRGVFSTKLSSNESNTRIVSGDIENEVAKIVNEPGKDI